METNEVTRYKVYKHTNNTDVAMLVLHSIWIPQKKAYKVKCRWINIAMMQPTDMGIVQKVWIKKEQLLNWKEYKLTKGVEV